MILAIYWLKLYTYCYLILSAFFPTYYEFIRAILKSTSQYWCTSASGWESLPSTQKDPYHSGHHAAFGHSGHCLVHVFSSYKQRLKSA